MKNNLMPLTLADPGKGAHPALAPPLTAYDVFYDSNDKYSLFSLASLANSFLNQI